MPTLAELKSSSPAYAQMSDEAFAGAIYRKHYADKMSLDDFAKKVGYGQPASPTAGMSGFDKFAAGMGKSMVDTAQGVSQFFGGADAADIEQRRAQDAPLMDSGAGMAGNIVGQGLQMAVPIPAGAAIKATSWAGKAAPYVGAAARAGVFGGAQGVGEGESRAARAGQSAALGVAGQGIASGVGAMASRAKNAVPEALRRSIDMAERAGIPLHASQVRDSRFLKGVTSALNELPFSGGGRAAQRQQEGFNRAIGRSFGVDDAATLSDEVMQGATDRIGAAYDDIFSRATIRLDDKAMKAFDDARAMAARNLVPDDARIVSNQIDDIIKAAENGMPGKQYQAFRTDRLMPLESGGKSFATKMIRDVRKALDDAANRSVGPEDAKALAVANRQYRNKKAADKALTRVEGSKGNVQPAALWNIVNQKFGSTPEMRELAKIGQNVLKDPIPNSGTPLRQLVYGLTAGGGALAAGIAPQAAMTIGTGAALARILNSNVAAKALKPGAPTSGLARLLKPAPKALPAMAGGIPITGGRRATKEEQERDAEIVRKFRNKR